MEAVQENGLALEFASEKLRNDEEVVTTAVTHNLAFSSAIEFASKNVKLKDSVVLKIIEHNGANFEFVPEKFKDNFCIVMSAVRNFGYAIMYASKNLQLDPDIKTAAINQNNNATKFIDDI